MKILKMLCITTVLSLLFSGCSSAPKIKDNSNLTAAIKAEPSSLDPQYQLEGASMDVIKNIYETLVGLTDEGEGTIVPKLAREWKISGDGMNCTFYLNETISFHDGSILTAEDVVFSVERAMASPFCNIYVDAIESVEAIDKNTVTVYLNKPFAPILRVFATPNFSIVSKDYMTKMGDKAARNPMGTGPYQFQKWDMGQSISLKKFDNYHSEPAKIENINLEIIKETSTAMIALEKKEVDFLPDVDSVSIKLAEKNSDLAIYSAVSNSYWYLGFNCGKEPFNNAGVRNAISYAINKEDIMTVARGGLAVPAEHAIPSAAFGHTDEVKANPYDIEKAKELLGKTPYAEGFTCVMYVRDDFTKKIGQVVQSQLSPLNIKVRLEVFEKGAFMEQLRKSNHQLFALGHGDSARDAAFSMAFVDSRNVGTGGNFLFNDNDMLDNLLDQAKAEQNEDIRKKMYVEALKIEKEEAYRVPLYYNTVCSAADSGLKGINTKNFMDLKGIHWE